MKKISIKKLLLQVVGIIVILILFYHFAYPRIFVASIKNQLMVAYNTNAVSVTNPRECKNCKDGKCSGIKINCFNYNARVGAFSETIEYSNYKLDYSKLNDTIVYTNSILEVGKKIKYETIIMYDENNEKEVTIVVNDSLLNLLDIAYLNQLDDMNISLFNYYPDSNINGESFNFYIKYKDGYRINLNQKKNGSGGIFSNYMVVIYKNKKEYFMSPYETYEKAEENMETIKRLQYR